MTCKFPFSLAIRTQLATLDTLDAEGGWWW